jgi:hypothetical protein
LMAISRFVTESNQNQAKRRIRMSNNISNIEVSFFKIDTSI